MLPGVARVKLSSKEVSAAGRALWLASLAEAIDEAQQLAWRLGVVEGKCEALDLYVRLEIARAEVEALRERRPTTARAAPDQAAELFPPQNLAHASDPRQV